MHWFVYLSDKSKVVMDNVLRCYGAVLINDVKVSASKKEKKKNICIWKRKETSSYLINISVA